MNYLLLERKGEKKKIEMNERRSKRYTEGRAEEFFNSLGTRGLRMKYVALFYTFIR